MIGKQLSRQQAPDGDAGALVAQAAPSSDIEIQVRTANAYPRDLKLALDEAMGMARVAAKTPDEHGVPGGLWYELNRGGKPIHGPSIRLAEIVAYAWRNLRITAHLIHVGQREVTVEGIALDLERNVAERVEVFRRIVDREGRRYSDDMINVTVQAACSIARRNAIFAIVPEAFTNEVLRAIQPQDGKPARITSAEEIFAEAEVVQSSVQAETPASPAATQSKPTRSRAAAGAPTKIKTSEIIQGLSWLPDEAIGRALDGARMAAGGDEDIYAENVRLLPTIPRTMLEAALEDGGKPAWDSIFQAAKAQGALGV